MKEKYILVEENGRTAKLGNNVSIGYNTIIYPNTIILDDVVVGDNCVIGKPPSLAKTSTLTPEHYVPLVIGKGTTICSLASIFTGSVIGENCLIGDSAFIREKVIIGNNCLVGRGVTIENDTTLGNNVKCQAHAYITAYMTIEDCVFIAPCVVTTNDNFMGRTEKRFALKRGATIRKGARIGANSILLPGITIGKEVFVACGSVVTKDIPDYSMVKGIPARIMKTVPKEEWSK